jgi:hypothetical protein
MTKFFTSILILLTVIVSSCGICTKDEAKTASDTAKITVATFLTRADSLVEKPVIIEGTVLHTCKHSGKRMFLVDGNDSVRVEVTAGETITKFDESLVGSRVLVTGVLKEERIDAKYLNEWEAEVKKPAENHDAGVHSGAKGHEDQGVDEKLMQIAALRDELKNSGKDHLSNFSIEAAKFTEIK